VGPGLKMGSESLKGFNFKPKKFLKFCQKCQKKFCSFFNQEKSSLLKFRVGRGSMDPPLVTSLQIQYFCNNNRTENPHMNYS